mgnify:CR=1 FL=1
MDPDLPSVAAPEDNTKSPDVPLAAVPDDRVKDPDEPLLLERPDDSTYNLLCNMKDNQWKPYM